MSTWDTEPDEDRELAPTGGAASADPALPLEADAADVIDQTIAAAPDGDTILPRGLDVPLEASEADVIDQASSVLTDDDDE